jgi:hypothetical protein
MIEMRWDDWLINKGFFFLFFVSYDKIFLKWHYLIAIYPDHSLLKKR